MLLHAFETTCRYEKDLVQQEGMRTERNATAVTARGINGCHLQNDAVSVHTQHQSYRGKLNTVCIVYICLCVMMLLLSWQDVCRWKPPGAAPLLGYVRVVGLVIWKPETGRTR